MRTVLAVLFATGAFLPATRFPVLGYFVTAAELLLTAAGTGLFAAFLVLLFGRVWSFRLGVVLAAVGLLGLGGVVLPATAHGAREVVRAVRGLEFVRPWWLVLLGFVPVVVGMSRRTLSGLGPVRKWAAVGLRATIVALLAMALAEPRIRRPSENVTVLFVADRSYSVPQDVDPNAKADEAVDRRWARIRGFIEAAVRTHGLDHRDDQTGLIQFGRRPRLALPPAPVLTMPVDERMAGPIDGNYTDIAAALKLALASFPEGTAKRVVLVSDGNENIGSAEEQANIAKQNGVQIDTVALAPGYRNQSEVLVQAVEAPPTSSVGQRLPVRVLIRNANPDRVVDGRLDLLKVGREGDSTVPIEDGPQVLEPKPPALVRLLPGLNVFRFRDRADVRGETSFSYRATFTPTRTAGLKGENPVAGLPGDRPANNRATAAVVSRGQRRVLFLDDGPSRDASPHRHLLDALERAKIRVDHLPSDKLPGDTGDLAVFLTNYDEVVIGNVPYERFSGDQAEAIRAAVYDQGCGLVMIGGPDSYGPGGYQGTAIEAALPVDCEIKALKAAGRGGLVLIMHASEMADGNKWQKDIAKLAIQRLNANDMVGITQYGFGTGGVNWHVPFQEVGEDKSRFYTLIDRMTPGDMPDFDPFLQAAADELGKPEHNLAVKHCILISDGDPNYSSPGLGKKAVDQMAANGITCTTVGVATHGGAEKTRLKAIASGTRDGAGKPGNFYDVTNPNQLPAIYIKESRRVSQSFVYDKRFDPQLLLRGGPSDGLPNNLPPLWGFVRTTKKENPLVEMQIEGPRVFDQRFPVLASWRYGLGKAVAFTADARTQPGSPKLHWDRDWVASDIYQKFWETAVTWALREAERGRLQLVTEYRDGRIRVTADVRDDKDKPVSGLDLQGKVTLPRPPGPGEKVPTLEFRPRGAGVYEAEIPAEEAGSYFVTVQAQRPQIGPDGKPVRDANGQPTTEVFDAARSGVTVPYSPEFADLESNTPLLRRLSEMTGGEFHTDDAEELKQVAASGRVYREAPGTVRALLPFWYWLVFAAGILLVFDVGVRRVAVEAAEVRAAGRFVWSRLRGEPEVVAETGAGLGRLLQRKQAVGDTLERERAARRFEPTATGDPTPSGADEFAARVPPPPPAAPPVRETPAAAEDADDPLARLRKARNRARHRQDGEDEPGR